MSLNYHIGCFVLGLLCVAVRVQFGWGGIRVAGKSVSSVLRVLRLQPAARIPPQTNCTLTPTHSKPRTKQPMW